MQFPELETARTVPLYGANWRVADFQKFFAEFAFIAQKISGKKWDGQRFLHKLIKLFPLHSSDFLFSCEIVFFKAVKLTWTYLTVRDFLLYGLYK